MKKSIIALLVAFCMFVVGCTSQQKVVTALQGVSIAASVAVPTIIALEASGKINAADAKLALTYAGLVSTASSKATAELQSNDPSNTKISVIIADFEPIAAPSIGSSSPEVFAAVNAISSAVTLLVSELKSGQITVTTSRNAPTSVKVAIDNLKLSRSDKNVLKQVKKTCEGLVVQVNTWRPQLVK